MKSLDSDNDFVAIIINFERDNKQTDDEYIVLSEKYLSLNGVSFTSDLEWKNDYATILKVFKRDDVKKLFDAMNNESFGRKMIAQWGLSEDMFIFNE